MTIYSGALLDVSLETAQMMMDVNLYGTLRLVRLVGPQMAKRGKGLILPVGSTAGELSVPFRGHYNASKAALHAFTETLAEECRPLGVHVMLCSPGTVVSNIINVIVVYHRTSLRTVPDLIYRRKQKHSIYQTIRFTSDIKSGWLRCFILPKM